MSHPCCQLCPDISEEQGSEVQSKQGKEMGQGQDNEEEESKERSISS